jgi:hypothetical protein
MGQQGCCQIEERAENEKLWTVTHRTAWGFNRDRAKLSRNHESSRGPGKHEWRPNRDRGHEKIYRAEKSSWKTETLAARSSGNGFQRKRKRRFDPLVGNTKSVSKNRGGALIEKTGLMRAHGLESLARKKNLDAHGYLSILIFKTHIKF